MRRSIGKHRVGVEGKNYILFSSCLERIRLCLASQLNGGRKGLEAGVVGIVFCCCCWFIVIHGSIEEGNSE